MFDQSMLFFNSLIRKKVKENLLNFFAIFTGLLRLNRNLLTLLSSNGQMTSC